MHALQPSQKTSTSKQSGSRKQTIRTSRTPTPFDTILSLHSTLGNQAVQRFVQSGILQTRLKVGAPNDIYQQEADRVAGQVMRMLEPDLQTKPLVSQHPQITPIQRLCPECEEEMPHQPMEEEQQRIQTQAVADSPSEVAPDLESKIQSQRGSGQPLPESSRNFFGPRMGTDFSSVRVHNSVTADNLNQALNARAFTTGQDIFFRHGEYNPGSSSGKELLAHELTHVVQQGKG